MVTKLKTNIGYIDYIRNKANCIFPEWTEDDDTLIEGQINNNFQINFIASLQGYPDSIYKISFIKDRELLELQIFYKDEPIHFGYLIYNGIMNCIPDQNAKWRLSLCTELIDYYFDFLKSFFEDTYKTKQLDSEC